MKKLYFSIIVLSLCCLIQQAFAQSAPTVYSTPGAYVYSIPAGATSLGVDVRGAQGGNGSWSNGTGGLGGKVTATLTVPPGVTVLYVYVGSQPANSGCGSGGAAGSSFGGGEDGGTGSSMYGECGGAGGGAASDIRTTSGSLTTRLIVGAGGGGSGYACGEAGGAGGGTTGGNGNECGSYSSGTEGSPGTLSGPGSGGSSASSGGLGYGGNSYNYGEGAGGGAGYYGAGGAYYGSACGGSSYPASGTTGAIGTTGTTISSVTNTGGSQTGSGYVSIQVLCNGVGAITGTTPVCIGGSSTLSNTTAGVAGTWSISPAGVATVNASTGVVTGIGSGLATITYNVANPCGTLPTTTVSINPAAAPITGTMTVCTGLTTALSETSSGTWNSSVPGVATVSSSGIVSAASAGTTTISYTLLTGCAPATTVITVNPNPPAIVGANNVCVGSTTTLSDGTSGGIWTSGTPGSATITGSGALVTGISAGPTNITYTLPAGCIAVLPMTVNPLPAAIGGVTTVCVGSSVSVTDATSGGVWTSTNPAQATINAGTGLATGVFAGAPNMVYTLPTGCKVSTPFLVNPLPLAIGGSPNVCVGATTNLTETGGGSWTSSNPLIASISALTGIVTGVGPGTASMTYSLATGCSTSIAVNCNALPSIYAVTGGGTYCSGTAGVHIGAVYGASGVNYQLILNGSTAMGAPVAGINATLDFGLETATGTYTVVGTNGFSGCSSNMSGLAIVGLSASPAIHNVTGGGGYCPGTSGSGVGVDASNSGVNYQLYNGSAVGAPLTGSGPALNFGLFTAPGTYTVMATNIATGCSVPMNGTANISENPVVSTYPVTGGGGYCPGGAGAHVTLSGSVTGTHYQLFYNGVTTYPSGYLGGNLPGTGGVLDFGLETATGTYTVVGTDDVYGCTANMSSGTTLSIYPSPSAYAVTGGGNYCTGSTGKHVGVSFGSTGIDYVLYGPGIQDTVVGSGSGLDFGLQTAPGTYTVIGINPVTGCNNNMTGSATISISIAPGLFSVTGGGNYCTGAAGEPIALTGSELSVNYQLYKSGLPVGSVMAGTGGTLNFGTFTSVGTYTIIGTNATAPCVTNMAGSASININPLPSSYLVTGGGNYCIGGTGKTISLSGSQPGNSYTLWYGGAALTLPVEGSGSSVLFGSFTGSGAYTVTASNDTTSCTNNMTGSVTININALPVVHNVTGGGPYCLGGTGVSVGVDGSNTGVSYTLYNDGIPAGAALVGSGSTLSYGLKTAAGTYTVIATDLLTSCRDTMNSTAVINIKPLPANYPLGGGGNLCYSSTSGVDINVPSGSESGTTYQLIYAGSPVGTPQTGTGSPLDFGSFTGGGIYTLHATTSGSCSGTMTGSVSVNIVTPPVYTVTGGGNYCADGTGVHVSLSSSSTDDSYQLFGNGAPIGGLTTGTGASIDFGLETTSGSYTIVASDNSLSDCSNDMASFVNVGINPLPDMDSVTGGGIFCEGSTGVHLGLNTSSVGVTYGLFNGTTAVTTRPGTGTLIDFGVETTGGTYSVVATNTATTCTSNMLNNAMITVNPSPVQYRVGIENFGNYCAADSGLHISLSNSDAGITYQLFRDGLAVGSAVPGSGSGLILGLENIAGTYTVIGNDAATTCNSTMLGSSLLNIIPLPAVYNVTGGGSFCPSGNGVHVGLSGSQAGIYYELYDNVGTMMGTKYGTGTAIDFGLQTAGGTYTVIGNSAVTTCPNNMYSSATVVVDTLPLPQITLRAFPGSGVGVWHIDSMKVFIANSVGAATFQWSINGHNIAGATSETFSDHEFFNNDVVSCTVTAHGPCGGLSATQSIVITLENVGVANVTSAGNDLKLIPNPNKGAFNLKGTLGSSIDQEVSLEVTNMLGQVVYKNTIMTQGGSIDQHIQMENSLPNGMYLLNLHAGSESAVFHFVIEQ